MTLFTQNWNTFHWWFLIHVWHFRFWFKLLWFWLVFPLVTAQGESTGKLSKLFCIDTILSKRMHVTIVYTVYHLLSKYRNKKNNKLPFCYKINIRYVRFFKTYNYMWIEWLICDKIRKLCLILRKWY